MTRQRTEQEPAFVLHTYPYKETSLIVEAFTRHRGRVGVLARGARRPRSPIRGMLLAFHPLSLSWSPATELGTLMRVEWTGGLPALTGLPLMCGFYINELLMRLLPREDPHEQLFDAYGTLIQALAAGSEPAALLRAFELRLLRELGYAPPLDHDAASGRPVVADRRYVYLPEQGPIETAAAPGAAETDVSVSGQTLLDMSKNEFQRPETRDESRRLMRRLIAARLSGQTLHTSDMLRQLQDL